ncbi:hypothetical protein GUJ93_ZPchr0013g38034 [Zizania palustris]|uniref:Uncharacterized protein n=1 Tax=Zizania palustris TaxID=103762 RepID=A0A8J5WTH6_ZIZPA|nr:hypothetical protein GUJ93_ZPchr0013g38034 [Zizania palustris]
MARLPSRALRPTPCLPSRALCPTTCLPSRALWSTPCLPPRPPSGTWPSPRPPSGLVPAKHIQSNSRYDSLCPVYVCIMENKGKSKSNDSEKIVCQADWENLEMTTIFCNIVVEEIQAGNRPLGIPTASDEWWETNTKGHLKREKRTFCYAPPPCLKQWEIMFEKSHVL